MQHQFVDRETGTVLTERIYADRVVNFLYSTARERAPFMFRALTGARASALLAYFNYDFPLGMHLSGIGKFLTALGVDVDECVDPPRELNTARKVFERKIRYWDCRPMPEDPAVVVSPADAKCLVGSLHDESELFIKEKFFSYPELLGGDKRDWLHAFRDGDYAIFRLTPEMYHYNHAPVAGEVVDIYEVHGAFHSCNPGAVIQIATPYSKNRRVVTIIDTDVHGGSRVGLVALIEIVALMIGEVVQAYSARRYDDPRPVEPGTFLVRGAPKSLYRPGSSTDVVLFQQGRVRFDADLLRNRRNVNVTTRFGTAWGAPLVETGVRVRSSIARRVEREAQSVESARAMAARA
jgi:phosphatidylserine decarboxylase